MKWGKMPEIYSNVLSELRSVDGVKMTALGSRDGFLISDYETSDSEMLTLMGASMIRAAETAAKSFDRPSLNRVIVDFSGGKLIAASAGPKAVVSLMTNQEASLDTIISKLDLIVDKIKEII